MDLLSSGVANPFHLPPVPCQLVAAFSDDTRRRDHSVPPCLLFYANERRVLEPG